MACLVHTLDKCSNKTRPVPLLSLKTWPIHVCARLKVKSSGDVYVCQSLNHCGDAYNSERIVQDIVCLHQRKRGIRQLVLGRAGGLTLDGRIAIPI